jgi:hypothetical protein
MQIAKKFLPFLKTDESGNYGVVVSVDSKSVSLDLNEGVTLKIDVAGVLARVGDKMYFNEEGTMTKMVQAKSAPAPKRESTPRSGCARIVHPY